MVRAAASLARQGAVPWIPAPPLNPRESIAGLLAFGAAAIPAMRECVDSLDYEMIRHGHRVLAGLGDDASQRWLREDDDERIAAYLERKGLSDDAALPYRVLIANDPDEPKQSA